MPRRSAARLAAAGAAGTLGGCYAAARLQGDAMGVTPWTVMYQAVRPVLFNLFPPEEAHAALLRAGRLMQQLPVLRKPTDAPVLRTRVLDLEFSNPIGMAAGFDKNAEVPLALERAGWGFVEVGSVSAKSSEGNPKPRCFRLEEDRAVINRMGLNNVGAAAVSARLKEAPRGGASFPVGINIAKTHDPALLGAQAEADFCAAFRELAPHADYVTLNISCPNTREGKTFERPSPLERLLTAINKEKLMMKNPPPVLVKLSPMAANQTSAAEADVKRLVRLCLSLDVAGFVASNTVPDRNVELRTAPEVVSEIGPGGLSGKPAEQRSTALVRLLRKECDRVRPGVPIIGVGGVSSADDAYAKIRAGASLVQLYTAIVYEGPFVHRDIVRGLTRMLERDGFASVADAVGVDA
eukprot:TRINITY_DN64811_c0_g1_i1.p1 TRINITY_DN64811_c0_g1~~TRINITY_DN64811_c0_g1_i1.p1  ORF type:complete len:436 (+),score=121.70 TRINITY_DN64811_c0_g1_i1:82-1308(+)